ncbi:MAG: hypothetical protein ACI8UP_001640, partial [Porticoccaceae bacterium]
NANFNRATLTWADLSRLDLSDASVIGADMSGALVHSVIDRGVNWAAAKTEGIRKTDPDRAAAEAFKPPQPTTA